MLDPALRKLTAAYSLASTEYERVSREAAGERAALIVLEARVEASEGKLVEATRALSGYVAALTVPTTPAA